MTEDSEVQITLALKSLNESSNLLGLKILAGNATKKNSFFTVFLAVRLLLLAGSSSAETHEIEQ